MSSSPPFPHPGPPWAVTQWPLAGPATRRVELGFWRDRALGFAPIPCAGEDALFVQGDFDWLPEGRIPLCSHT